MNNKEIFIFISYSHLDNKWFKQDKELYDLIPFLERSLQNKNVQFWYDRHADIGIEAGDMFRKTIESEIDRSDIALLLISQEFLNSKFIAKIELPRIQNRYEKENLQVFPILLEPCGWDEIEFISSLQLVPGKPTPLLEFTDNEKLWKNARYDILQALKKKIDKISGAENLLSKKEEVRVKNDYSKPFDEKQISHLIIEKEMLGNDNIISNDIFIDSRDGEQNPTIKVGNQIWMARNLSFDPGSGYFNAAFYNKEYGMFYDYETALKVCPEGWHIPDHKEWQILINDLGGIKAAIPKILVKGDSWLKKGMWSSYGAEITNETGFSIYPTGGNFLNSKEFQPENHRYKAYFWTSDQYLVEISMIDENIIFRHYLKTGDRFAVRCVENKN